MEQPPATAGIVMANWYWKVVRQFVSERFGISLSRSSCLNWLHRLGFAFKRPKKRLLKADESKREAFVAEYAVLWEEAQRTGARIFFADEAHFRADAELRGKWVLKGKPALVDSSSPRYGEKASYYSAVCLETGEVEWMELEGNSNSGTSVAFLTQLKEKHPGPLRVIWDNAPAHRGEAVREYLRTPELELRLVNLPGYSPDFNADEAVWGWAREEAVLGQQGGGAGACRQIPGRAVQPERRGETVLPDGPAIKGRNTPARLPPRFPAPCKCTSHLGFGLGTAATSGGPCCSFRTKRYRSGNSVGRSVHPTSNLLLGGGWEIGCGQEIIKHGAALSMEEPQSVRLKLVAQQRTSPVRSR